MVKVYIYSKCSTCKNAVKFLEQHKIASNLHEITTEPPTLPELEQMLKFQGGNLRKLFNTSGMLYKELGLSQKLEGLSVKEALLLLSKHGMLVKRPFLLGPNFGLVGFNEKQWKDAF